MFLKVTNRMNGNHLLVKGAMSIAICNKKAGSQFNNLYKMQQRGHSSRVQGGRTGSHSQVEGGKEFCQNSSQVARKLGHLGITGQPDFSLDFDLNCIDLATFVRSIVLRYISSPVIFVSAGRLLSW